MNSTSLLHRRRATPVAALAALLVAGAGLGAAPVVHAGSTIFVTTTAPGINEDGECSLAEAIYAANLDDNTVPAQDWTQTVDTACVAGDGADIIELLPGATFTHGTAVNDVANYTGPAITPMVTSEIIIEGRGARIRAGAGGVRAFAVGPGGDLDLREVHVKGFSIHGGNGADGGGGGMGAGGAIYVDLGTLRVQWSTFEANSATGGNGSFQDSKGAGGGGGLSGNGGPATLGNGDLGKDGGGGGGSRGDGSGNLLGSSNPSGGGGRITDADPVTGTPGFPCGGEGGHGALIGAADGEDATCEGGGGGGGEGVTTPISDPFCGGAGGDGHYGGGGGGGALDADGGHGGFGGGGGGGGGDGGFGGGGGSGEMCVPPGFADRGQGGTFAGDGSINEFGNGGSGTAGGGGAGLGGAIFGVLGDITIVNSTFAYNSAVRGLSGGDDARDGRGAGGAVMTVGGDLVVESSTFSGNEAITVTNGGGGAIVVYDPEGPDEASLRLRNSILADNGRSECYTRNGVTTTGSARNIIMSSWVNNLDDPSCPGVFSSNDPFLQPLLKYAPGRTPTMAIPLDSIAVDNADAATSPLDDQRGVARPQGAGPDIGAYEAAATGPTTDIQLDPAAADGDNGWYVSPVAFELMAQDPDGSIAELRCALDPANTPASYDDLPAGQCALLGTGADGHHVLYAASKDNDGNIEVGLASEAFKVDRTDPELDPSLNVTSIVLGQAGVEASANASDAVSKVASSSCDSVDTSTIGVHTVSCSATDKAGNTASESLTYVVEVDILGFFSPVPGSKWRAGQTVPVKVGLGAADASRLPDAIAAAIAEDCRITFSAAGVQSKSACLRYDPGTDQFIFNWKLKKQPTGPVTFTVSVTYAGSNVVTELSEAIEIVR